MIKFITGDLVKEVALFGEHVEPFGPTIQVLNVYDVPEDLQSHVGHAQWLEVRLPLSTRVDRVSGNWFHKVS